MLLTIYGGITDASTTTLAGPSSGYVENRASGAEENWNFWPNMVNYASLNPPAMHTTGRGHGWARPDVHVPMILVAHSR